ncbi:MAG: xanthine dehydrogenase molybdopterin binding subunit, partial [Alphaproteobacteria bacterium]
MSGEASHLVHRAIVGKGIAHDSAARHVAGTAHYIDDMPELPGTLHAVFVLSPVAHGRLKGFDASAALAMRGVAGVWAAGDVPGHNEVGPILAGETLFAEDVVDHEGRVIAVVAADDFETAYRAARKVKLDIEVLEPV